MFPEQLVVGGSPIHQAARNRRAEVLLKGGMSEGHVFVRYMNYFNTVEVMRVEAQTAKQN